MARTATWSLLKYTLTIGSVIAKSGEKVLREMQGCLFRVGVSVGGLNVTVHLYSGLIYSNQLQLAMFARPHKY